MTGENLVIAVKMKISMEKFKLRIGYYPRKIVAYFNKK